MNWIYPAGAIAGYLLGGVLFSYHIPLWLKQIDITAISADGNPGGANAVKHAGAPVGLICLAADMLKGFLPVALCAYAADAGNLLFALVMSAPVLGHATAPFYRSVQGGKAIAVSFGVLLAVRRISKAVWVLAGLYLLFSLLVPVRPHEKRTVAAFGLLAVWALAAEAKRRPGVALGCMAISSVVMWKNRRAPEIPA